VARSARRRFTPEYKRRILQEAEACGRPGEIAALLRREGLYSSHLVAWRRARARGELVALAPRKRGPKPKEPMGSAAKLAGKNREIARLRAENERLRGLCEMQEKRIDRLLDELRALIVGDSGGKTRDRA
jgi:transposase-like protein